MKSQTLGALAALSLVGAGLTGAALAAPVFVGDFETGNLGQYQTLDLQAQDRIQVVQSPVKQGQYAVKTTVQPGDYIKLGARAEYVITNPMFEEGQERWFHWYTRFPEDFRTSPKWHLFTQWHSGEFGVPLYFSLHGEQMGFRVMGTQYDQSGRYDAGYLWTAPLQRGEWMEFLLRVKFSSNPNVGFVELWKDGKKVVEQTFHQTLYPGGSVYVKQGLYRDRSIDWNQSVFHDGMTVYSGYPDHLFAPPPQQPPVATNPPATPGPDTGGGHIPFPETPTLVPDNPLEARLPRAEGNVGLGSAGCGSASMAGMLFPLAALASLPLFRRRRR